MSKITVFNTWVGSGNIGDKIIMESSKNVINNIFKEETFIEIPTHIKLTLRSHHLMNNSSFKFVCGTNLLKSNMFFRRLWKINFLDSFFLNDVILLGVGWKTYSQNTEFFTKRLWNRILSNDKIHSVRDEYTKQKLNEIGINNVINTSCPTMWTLDPAHCKEIPQEKSSNVVATITDYRKDHKRDRIMFQKLIDNYKNVYIWPQSFNDIKYIKTLNISDTIEILSPNLNSYDSLLNSNINIDYIGTRLHAGIRALQKKRRTIIIGVDNRAIEKEKFGIEVLKRNKIEELDSIINRKISNDIKIPLEKINSWKEQFNKDKISYKPKNHLIFDKYDSFKESIKVILNYDKKQINKK